MRIDVRLHDRRVGVLVREEPTGIVSFVLDEDYLGEAVRPILGQHFEDRREHRIFRQAAHPGRLPTFFANLLPEGALQAMVKAQAPGHDDAATLEFVGADLPGAVVVERADSDRPPRSAPRGRAFDEPTLGADLAPLDELRFSLAGVQLKFSAVRLDTDRFTLPFRGREGRWILKFASPQYPSLPENEFITMRWAAACGLAVPRHELVAPEAIGGLDPRFRQLGPAVFVIERYDRSSDGGRVHQEDFAQVRGILPEQKYAGASYEALARFVGDVCGRDDLVEFVRRIVFVILSGNTDAHLKNWSLIYPDHRAARLSPVYDFVFVRQYLPSDRLSLPLAKERDPTRIDWNHFHRLERFLRERGHPVAVTDLARDFAGRALRAWDDQRDAAPAAYREGLEAYLGALPIARDLRVTG